MKKQRSKQALVGELKMLRARVAALEKSKLELGQRVESLRETEQFSREVITGAGEGIVVYDCELRYLVWNRFMENLTGVPAADILGKKALDVFPHLRKEGVDRLLERALAGETLCSQDTPYHAPQTGKSGWVIGTYAPHRDARGKIIGVVAMIHDITERSRTQAEMLLEKARFQQLFENSPLAIAVVDPEDRIQAVNSAFQKIFQYRSAEVTGYPINDVIVPSVRSAEASQLSSQVLNGMAVEKETVRQRKDGTLIPVQVYGVPIVHDRKPMGVFGIYADMTALRQVEGELKREVEKLSALHEIDRALATLDLQACLHIIVRQARTLFATDAVAILLREGEQLRLVAEEGLVSASKEILIPLGSGLTGWSYARCESLLVPDVLQDSRYLNYDVRTRTEMVAPLVVQDDCIGVLNIESTHVNAFTPADLELLESLAARAAMAIHNARLHSAEREQRQFAEALREIGMALTSRLDPNAVLDLLLDNVARVLPYDTAAVLLVNDGMIRTEHQRGYEQFAAAQHMQTFEMPLRELPILSEMAASGQPRAIADTRKEPQWVSIEWTRHIRSWLGAPIITRGRLLGFLNLEKAQPDFYTAGMAERLATLTAQAGLAYDNARLYAEQQKFAVTDSLTGLFNRRHFAELATRELQRARRQQSPFVLLMIDLDDFKIVNDSCGHSIGDQALQLVAATLAKSIRGIDVLARYGGDEFVILLPDCPQPDALQIVARLQERIRQIHFPIENSIVELNFSVGIAISTLSPEETLDSLLVRADAEMYRQKQNRQASHSST